jgi:hypothetical protein
MKKPPAAPPVYRPLPQPKVLQRRTAPTQSIQRSVGNPAPTPPAPPPPVPVPAAPAAVAPVPAPLPGVRVGGPGAVARILAARNWPDNTAYARALAILRELETARTEFASVDAIIAHVNADAQVAAARSAAAVETRVVGTVDRGVQVRVSDIRGGTWQPLTGPGRTNDDWELFVRLDDAMYSLHVHGPWQHGGPVRAGQVMRGTAVRGVTPQAICDEILRIKGRPEGW